MPDTSTGSRPYPVQLARLVRVKRGPAQQVIVGQPWPVGEKALGAGVEDKEQVTGAKEVIEQVQRAHALERGWHPVRRIIHVAVDEARPVTPLVTHVGPNGQVEEHPFTTALVQAILCPVVLDFVVIQDHVGWHAAQQLAHVPRPERAMVALLKLLVGIRKANGHKAVVLVRIDLIPDHE